MGLTRCYKTTVFFTFINKLIDTICYYYNTGQFVVVLGDTENYSTIFIVKSIVILGEVNFG